MADFSSCACCGERAATGVSEEINDLRRAVMFLAERGAFLGDASPLIPLFGEDAEVPEVGAAQLELRAIDGDGPCRWQLLATVPFVPTVTEECRGGLPPFDGGQGGLPDRLGAGSGEHDVSEAFEFLKPAAVEQLIV